MDSRKEIAAYLDRAVRTVQLWEKEEGLPIHRRPQKKRGAVYAYRSELDAWWANGRERLESREPETRRTNGKRIVVGVPAALLLAAALGTWYEGLRTPASSILHRRAPQPQEVDLMGRASPDGRYLSYADVDGELALYDLAT